MTMNDLVANYLTRVRNAIIAHHENVDAIPCSNVIVEISRVLKEEGYIKDYHVTQVGARRTISVDLKFYKGKNVISKIERISKPGRRIYAAADTVPYVRKGLGLAVISTSKGVLSDAKARELNVGGEVICRVW